jgi:Outer membrane lipoprotein
MCKKVLVGIAVISSLISLAGCAPDINALDYNSSQAGQMQQTVRGTVVGATPVKVSGSHDLGIGSLAGAAAGAVGGSVLGGGMRANLLGGLGGALLGGAAGDYAQKKLTQQTGMQYQVKLKNSREIITVVQGLNPRYHVGQPVYVLYGDKTRIVPAS